MVPVVASLLLYKAEKPSVCLSAICLAVTPISQSCRQQSKQDLVEVRPQSIYTYKSEKSHPCSIFSSTVFSKVSVAEKANIVPFDCLLGWHEQVYLQIFSNTALAFQSAHVHNTPFPFSL